MRCLNLFWVFAASLVGMGPVTALAQTAAGESVSVRDRARPDYDPLGRRVGGFDLAAALDLGASSTDNLFATSAAEQSDLVFHVSPSARLASHWSRHALGFDAGADFTNHQDFSSEDAETGYFGAFGRLDIGSRSDVSASARWAHQVEPRTNPDALAVGAPVEYDTNAASLTGRHRFNRYSVSGTLANVTYDYDDVGVLDQDFRDSEETSFSGRLDAELTPRLGAFVQARADQRDYDNSPGLNSDGRTLLAGITVNLTDLMRGEIAVGQFDREYDAGGSVDGVAVNAGLEWYVTRLTTVSFDARRDAQETGAIVSSPYVESEYGVRVDHELFRNTIIWAGGHTGRRKYEVITRDDDFSTLEAGAIYFLNRRVALNGRVAREENDSTDPTRDFEVNTLSLGVSLRL